MPRYSRVSKLRFLLALVIVVCGSFAHADEPGKVFRAGACAIDITPEQFPVVVNGGFIARSATQAYDPLYARCLVLDDGTTRLAIVVVDSCMMPREVVDRAKSMAAKATGIAVERMLIAATHTHSAPSVMNACLGTDADPEYRKLLPLRIAEGIGRAADKLAPVQVGWTTVDDYEHTNCRRWITRPDKMQRDPFGGLTVRAMMHPGYQNPDFVGPSGPVDPGLSLLCVRSPEGTPVALLANYSMHYFGAPRLSADYFGRFAHEIAQFVGAEVDDGSFVGIMSQGTSGDLHWMDYSQPKKDVGIDSYARAVAEVAYQAYQAIEYHDWVRLAMAERRLRLRRRVPDEERLAWARPIVEGMKQALPTSRPEVYARQAVYLHENPEEELKLQALRIGPLGITAIPNEVYGLTGLKLKAQSPLVPAFNIELANGAAGYIPPPEQHALGGYTTWPARTAGLEVAAEPKIVETLLELLEEVSGKPRRKPVDPQGPYPRAVLQSKPSAYWRLSEMAGSTAHDVSGHRRHGVYEPGVAFYLSGAEQTGFSGQQRNNRAAHFAGGRMKAEVPDLGDAYSVELWFWNGLPDDARAVTGVLFSRGTGNDTAGEQLAIGGTHSSAGCLLVTGGGLENDVRLRGQAQVGLRRWNHVVFTRQGEKVAVYLNGKASPEVAGVSPANDSPAAGQFHIGGSCNGSANFEGKIDEAAVYNRALSAEEVAAHFAAAGS